MNFSVLMSVYKNDRPEWVEASFASIQNQTKLPDEVVLVIDGPIDHNLEKIIGSFLNRIPLKIVRLPVNQGLGIALATGLNFCSNEIIIRADSDDINRFDRFLLIDRYWEDASADTAVIASYISEFINSVEKIENLRKFPKLTKVMQKHLRDPVAHPSVSFKKSIILSVGGYRNVLFFEDTDLWLRLIKSNYSFINIPESLVYMRINSSFFDRRRGASYILHEWRAFSLWRKERLITKSQFMKFFLRALIRLLPSNSVKFFYKYFLR